MKKPLGIKQWVLYCVAAPVALWLGITFVVNRYFTYDIDKTFPSPGFRSVVLSYLDLNHDGKLSRSEAGKVTELHLDNMDDLCDLRGIEVFRNLEELDYRYGYLTELNLSGNPKLTRLDCSYNILSRLDLRANRKLKKVADGFGIDAAPTPHDGTGCFGGAETRRTCLQQESAEDSGSARP